jgi:hypothetical protein
MRMSTGSACRAIAAALGSIVASAAVPIALASSAMPVEQQTALVQKYCAVCHTDAQRNGGLSLQHFDAAHPDPGVAAMLVSKLKAKAMGAADIPLPDQATQDALLSALSAEAVGASGWTVNRTQSPAISASIVREVPSTANGGEPDLYRLTLTCRADTHEAGMQLAWSPGVPSAGQIMYAAPDGMAPRTYKIDGTEKMGNGTGGASGPGAVDLRAIPLPARTLTIRNLFPNETVVFPVGDLDRTVRDSLSTCFAGSIARK